MARSQESTPSFFLNLGMISIPLKYVTGAREAQLDLDNMHAKCVAEGHHSKFNMLFRCIHCQEVPVPKSDMVKVKQEDGRFIVVTPEELTSCSGERNKTMDIVHTVRLATIDHIYFGRSGYLMPTSAASMQPYLLLRNSLESTGLAAFVRYAERGHDKIGIVRPYLEGLILHESFYQSEIRDMESKVGIREMQIPDNLLAMGQELLESMRAEWDITEYRDSFFDRVDAIVQAKRENAPLPVVAERVASAAPTQDLAALLRASMAVRRPAAAPEPEPEPVAVAAPEPERRPAARVPARTPVRRRGAA